MIRERPSFDLFPRCIYISYNFVSGFKEHGVLLKSEASRVGDLPFLHVKYDIFCLLAQRSQ
jgi:hypothetical protein